MKTIKFRIFNKKIKSYIDIHSSAIMIDELNNLNDNLIVEQFTGFHDKNGKEIYEGDILRYKYPYSKFFIHPVVFENGCYFIDDNVEAGKISLFFVVENKEIEIIGNIYENPELL